jgi:hypothetical protein
MRASLTEDRRFRQALHAELCIRNIGKRIADAAIFQRVRDDSGENVTPTDNPQLLFGFRKKRVLQWVIDRR